MLGIKEILAIEELNRKRRAERRRAIFQFVVVLILVYIAFKIT